MALQHPAPPLTDLLLHSSPLTLITLPLWLSWLSGMFYAFSCFRVFICWPQFSSLFVWLTRTYSFNLNLEQLIIKIVQFSTPPGSACFALWLCSSSHGGGGSLFLPLASALALWHTLASRREVVPVLSLSLSPRCRLLLAVLELHDHPVNKPGLTSWRIPTEAIPDQPIPANL